MKLNIGSLTYNLMTLNKIQSDEEDVEICGEVRPFECKILVANQFPPQVLKQTLWHEVVHAMLYEIGMQELSQDEGFVDAFSKQIEMFLRKNDLTKIYKFIGDSDGATNQTKNTRKPC